MSEICPYCHETSFTDKRTSDDNILCWNCAEEFQPIPSSDGMFVDEGFQEENARRQDGQFPSDDWEEVYKSRHSEPDLSLHYADCTCSACNDEDDPDLEDSDQDD